MNLNREKRREGYVPSGAAGMHNMCLESREETQVAGAGFGGQRTFREVFAGTGVGTPVVSSLNAQLRSLKSIS